MPPDILENDRKLPAEVARPKPSNIDKDFAGKWLRRLRSAGAHYDPVGHPVTADFGHLLFGHPRCKAPEIEPFGGRADLPSQAVKAMHSSGSTAFIGILPLNPRHVTSEGSESSKVGPLPALLRDIRRP
jgi:hypothetical protein